MAGTGTNWARFSTDVCGAKAHVVYDPDLGCPIYHMITEANVNDITAPRRVTPAYDDRDTERHWQSRYCSRNLPEAIRGRPVTGQL